MAKIRTGWYDRKIVPRVTLDWIKENYMPTQREMELLKIIQKRKLVSRDHLEIISPSFRHIGNNRTRLMNMSIKRMFENTIVDKIHEKQEIGKGNKPAIIALDRGGSVLLDIKHKVRIVHEEKTIKGKSYIFRTLPINFRHIQGINRMEVETIQFCEKTNSEIIFWEHEVNTEFTYGNEKIVFIPDVVVCLRIGDKKFYVFLEYDTGSENRGCKTNYPIILDKIKKYRKYFKSNLWVGKYDYFPYIFFVTEDDKRIEYFNKKCKENEIRGIGVYYKNFIEVLKELSGFNKK